MGAGAGGAFSYERGTPVMILIRAWAQMGAGAGGASGAGEMEARLKASLLQVDTRVCFVYTRLRFLDTLTFFLDTRVCFLDTPVCFLYTLTCFLCTLTCFLYTLTYFLDKRVCCLDTRVCAGEMEARLKASLLQVHGYLAHKNPPPVGPYSSLMPRDLWLS